MVNLRENLQNLLRRIASAADRIGRDPAAVRLLAVSKGQGPEQILEAAQLGQRDFGENYAQEWLEKKAALEALNPSLCAELRWHFIGHLQSNKADLITGHVALLHSLDSLKLAQKISAQCLAKNVRQAALFEINLGGESSKTGMDPGAFLERLRDFAALPGLDWRGLMAIPPPLDPPEKLRPYFRQLKSLLDECNRTGFFEKPLADLSMGMSHDFEIAVEEGATWVRVGTALFGPRSG